MMRPRTLEAFHELVKQALFEIDELRAAVEYELDEEGPPPELELLGPIRAELEELLARLDAGSYDFGGEPLRYMAHIQALDTPGLPIRPLLLRINDTHCHGLETGPDPFDGLYD
ncbi:MAG TPA: hypothetical protein ENK62_01135 [Chromatiales bacterium]|nr:hypothetical protein [Chromatiales bacterium]